MKIAFDENIPVGMVRAFEVLGKERQIKKALGGQLQLHKAKDFVPRSLDADHVSGSDVPWLKRFSASGGQGVISGDVSMRTKPHELQALKQLKLVVIFFERRWSGWDFFKKTALLMYYWPKVAKKLKTAKPGEFWCVPCHWREDGELRDVTADDRQKLTKKNPQAKAKKRVRKAASKKPLKSEHSKMPERSRKDPRQAEMDFPKKE
jgi:hypothetical protein